MRKKIPLILFSAIMMALIAIFVIHGSATKPTNDSREELQLRNFDFVWTPSPDWMIELAHLRSMGLEHHWVAQLLEAVAQERSNNNEHELAVEVLQTGFALFPRDADIAFRLGLECCITLPERGGQYLSIAADLDAGYTAIADEIIQAIPIEPRFNFDQWMLLGKALGRTGEWLTAEAIFQKVVQLAPDEADAWVLLGQAQEQNGRDGSTALFRAEKLDAASVQVRASLASYYATHGNVPKAIEIYSVLLKDEPDQPIWNIELGNLYSQTGDLIRAYDYFVSAVDLRPDKVSYWIALINFCMQYQIYVKEVGVPAARIAVNLEPDNPDALASMGEMLLLQGDVDNAVRFFTRAVEQNGHNAAYLYYLAECFRRTKNRPYAYNYYVKAIEEEGNMGYGEFARTRLAEYYSAQP